MIFSKVKISFKNALMFHNNIRKVYEYCISKCLNKISNTKTNATQCLNVFIICNLCFQTFLKAMGPPFKQNLNDKPMERAQRWNVS